MDDTPGAEQIRVNAQYNKDANVNNNQTLSVGVDRTGDIGNNDSLTVGVDSSADIGNDKSVTVGKPGTPDPVAVEHRSPWIVSTDGNHYLIDVNRDAFALSQLETQAAAAVMHHWNPQLWADNHGQPEEYYMAPFASPVNLNYPPSVLEWATEVGKGTARHFDRYGWTYVKVESLPTI